MTPILPTISEADPSTSMVLSGFVVGCGSLDDGYLEAVFTEPVSKHGACYAGIDIITLVIVDFYCR